MYTPTRGQIRGALSPAPLDNIVDVLADVRRWPGIVEKSTGLFYIGYFPRERLASFIGG